ncbi:hypothetical protein JXM67_13110 [candidate division WOR-3 bacterium]|nr:hypothetical protein [candidate division WOR-3 bacterium]
MEGLLTSDPEFLTKAIRYYKEKLPVKITDDAGWGLNKEDVRTAIALLSASHKKGGATLKKIAIIAGSLRVAGLGLALILIAVVDPEPTSKLAILFVGGTILVVSGGLTVLIALGVQWAVKVSRGSLEIYPKGPSDGGE